MNPTTAKHAIDQWDIENGGRENSIVDGNWIIFANGASRENLQFCTMIPPPTEPRELAQRVLRYHQVVLERAVTEFEEFKERLQFQAAQAVKYADASSPPPAPGEAELDMLRTLQAKVQKARREYNARRIEHSPQKSKDELDAIAARRTSGERAKAIIEEMKI